MENLNHTDKAFSQLMQQSKLKVPLSDLEENVMGRIEKIGFQTKGSFGDTKLSVFFFALGTILGVIVILYLPSLGNSNLGLSLENAVLLFQLSFILFFLLHLETLTKLVKKSKGYFRERRELV